MCRETAVISLPSKPTVSQGETHIHAQPDWLPKQSTEKLKLQFTQTHSLFRTTSLYRTNSRSLLCSEFHKLIRRGLVNTEICGPSQRDLRNGSTFFWFVNWSQMFKRRHVCVKYKPDKLISWNDKAFHFSKKIGFLLFWISECRRWVRRKLQNYTLSGWAILCVVWKKLPYENSVMNT